jgi:hypothetical protein
MLFHACRPVLQREYIDMPTIVERPEIAEPNWQTLDALLEQVAEWLSPDGGGGHYFSGSPAVAQEVVELCRITLQGELHGDEFMKAFSKHCREAALMLLDYNNHQWGDVRDEVISILGDYRRRR